MRTKFLLASCVLAAAVTGCQNDEFDTVGTSGQAASNLVEVGDNFMISGVGVTDPTTRTHWTQEGSSLVNAFLPVVANTGEGNTYLGTTTEVLSPTIGACALVGGSVYSNYEFYHYGWLATGEDNADFDECDADVLNNGWLYSEISTTVSTAGEEVAYNAGSWALSSTESKNGVSLFEDNLNLNSGIYKTENKAMFAGDYILYYPYDQSFTEGAIPATAKVEFDDMTKDNLESTELGDNTFRYAYAPDMVGGTTATSFQFRNLSGIVRITVNVTGGGSLTSPIERLMLYSPSSGFLEKVYLDASAIAAGQTGTDIYATGNEVTSKTILVNMESTNTLDNGDHVYITALPTTVSDLVVYAYADEKWASYEVEDDFEIKAGTGVGLEVEYADADFENTYLAVDDLTLDEAITNALNAGANANNPATITVLGDVTLDANHDYTNRGGTSTTGRLDIPADITVTGDKIIVPEGTFFVISQNATVESTIDVEGQTCCGDATTGGELYVRGGGTIAGEVNIMAGYEGKLAGSLTFGQAPSANTSLIADGAVVNANGDVTFDGNVDIRGTLNIAEDVTAEITEDGDVNVKGGTVVNDGTFEVVGNFAMLDANGSTTWSAGQNFTNNGTFIDYVGATVGGATQNMQQNGTYICKVDSQQRLKVAYEEKTACSVIELTNSTSVNYDLSVVEKHNEEDVDIIVSSTNDTSFYSTLSTTVTIGNLTVNGELDIVNCELTVNGDIMVNSTLDIEVTATLTVDGDITVAGMMTTADNMIGMTADNMTIVSGGTATFGERSSVTGTTLAVSGTIDVQQGGTLTLEGTSDDGTIARVTCTTLIEGGTFTNGKPEVVASPEAEG